ncbi:unnamed protein product [Toxocara canis]|uniref:Peptidase M24 n=1 Tax=Toxocara canis TaxID=6265 RepID=A0A183TX27_TOXCA|nr:unnamed protein product [Toxocara canis]
MMTLLLDEGHWWIWDSGRIPLCVTQELLSAGAGFWIDKEDRELLKQKLRGGKRIDFEIGFDVYPGSEKETLMHKQLAGGLRMKAL